MMKMNSYGGDISNINGLQHILSIGYEVECGILMKLTRSETGDSPKSSISSKHSSKSLEHTNSLGQGNSLKDSESWGLGKLFEGGDSSEINSSPKSVHSLKSSKSEKLSKSSKSSHSSQLSKPDKIVLFNSDTFTQDIIEFKKFEENPEDIDENIIARLEEMVEDNIYDDNNQIDPNSSFYITNDIAMSPFMRELTAVCYYASKEDGDNHTDEKNNLYLFRDTEKNQDYEINFLFRNPATDCATHSNVEWVFTYYRPQQGDNIIINTFLNMIKNLLRHLSDLQPITGNFIMKYKDDQGKDTELIIAKPEQRVLYHKPNTNLYYLLTQF